MPLPTPVRVPRVIIPLLPGWTQLPNPDGPATYAKGDNDRTGALQVSEQPRDQALALAADSRLDERAERVGGAFGWQGLVTSARGECAFGRFGSATFTGPFPATKIWILVSDLPRAIIWTWFGPDLSAPELVEAEEIVLAVRQRSWWRIFAQ